MASGTTLPVFPEFDLRDQTNLATRWEKYMKRFNNLMAAMDVKEESRKRALLLLQTQDERTTHALARTACFIIFLVFL